MAGQEETGGFGFDVGHQVAVLAVTDVVLRDGARIKCAVFERGFAFDAEKDAKIFAGEGDEFVVWERSQLGIAFAAYVAGES